MHYSHIETPIGRLRLRAGELGLVGVDHACQQEVLGADWCEEVEACHPVLRMATDELRAYFNGPLTAEPLRTPLAPMTALGTEFQAEVWEALLSIPYGETVTYADVAAEIGRPKAVRAVGAANGRNPLSIFVPCHRVIGKSGKLTGYAGGMEQKQFLLELESGQTGLVGLGAP